MRSTSLSALGVTGLLLVSLTVLVGCVSDPDAAPVAAEHARAAGPAPGSARITVSGSMAGYATYSR